MASLVVFGVALLTGGIANASGSVLLAFSSDHCGACQAMRPTLQKLEDAGVPIRHVNVNAESDLARRHGIRQVPTFIVLAGSTEMTRMVGAQSASKLYQALSMKAAGPRIDTGASFPEGQQSLSDPQTRLASNNRGTIPPASRSELMPSISLAQAVERARAATVRLRVHDGRGFGVGTGTIIDRHGPEALVLTCGHLFRETKLQSRIEVDLFIGGQVKTVAGQVVDYDSEERDIALVVIQPGVEIAAVPLLPATETPQSGEAVFSFGCDHGDDPTRRDTRLTGVNKYDQHRQASNLEIAGAPVDGRSGGGLFDGRGRLIGVCNAADYKGDVGIYTGPGSVQWQLDRVQLSHLYQGRSQDQMQPNTNPPQTRVASLGSNPISQPGRAAPEVTVIIRDPSRPGTQRVMTLPNPTAELMNMIGQQAVVN